MECFVFCGRGKRKGTEISNRGHEKDRGRNQREGVLRRGEYWVFGHCIGVDLLLPAHLGGSWVHAGFGPTEISRHRFMDEQVSESPNHQGQLAT